MRRTARRPRLGTALGVVAVLIASSSAAFAAGAVITKSSQIKNGVVTGADLKNGSVTGVDIKNGTVTGPDLKRSPWRIVGTASAGSVFQSIYDHAGDPYHLVAFRKGTDGRVYLRGAAAGTEDVGDATWMLRLPGGYRPKAIERFAIGSGDGESQSVGVVQIEPDGDITVLPMTNETLVNLDGISFATD
jgi:hypothetical protein